MFSLSAGDPGAGERAVEELMEERVAGKDGKSEEEAEE